MSKCLLPNTQVNQFSNFRARARRHIKPKGSFMKKEVKLFDFLQTFSIYFYFCPELLNGSTNWNQDHRATSSTIPYHQVCQVGKEDKE